MIEIGGWEFTPSFVILLFTAVGIIAAFGLIAQRFRTAGYVFVGVPPVIGIALGVSTLIAPNGYVADYGFGEAWILAFLLGLSSAVLVVIRRLRRTAIMGCISAAMLLLAFYVTFGFGYVLGF